MAQIIIKNPNDLIKILDARVSLALKMTQDTIFKCFQITLNDYYHEPIFDGGSIPKQYERTYKFLNSMIKTEIVKSGNSFSCTVEVDTDYLNYNYSGEATGKDVWDYANARTHGGTMWGNIEVWNDTIEMLGGRDGIMKLMKNNLKKCGVPITN